MLALQERTQAALNTAVVAAEVISAAGGLEELGSIHSGNKPFEPGFREVPEAKVTKQLPQSFDELAIYLDRRFGRLAAEVEQMAKELREAEMHSEQLRNRLLGGRSF